MPNFNRCSQLLDRPDDFLDEVARASQALRVGEECAKPALASLCPIFEIPSQQLGISASFVIMPRELKGEL
jgi:hypothetical protein